VLMTSKQEEMEGGPCLGEKKQALKSRHRVFMRGGPRGEVGGQQKAPQDGGVGGVEVARFRQKTERVKLGRKEKGAEEGELEEENNQNTSIRKN